MNQPLFRWTTSVLTVALFLPSLASGGERGKQNPERVSQLKMMLDQWRIDVDAAMPTRR